MLRIVVLAIMASLYVSSASAAAKQRVWIEVKPGKMAAGRQTGGAGTPE